MLPLSWGHVALSGDIFDYHNGRGRDASLWRGEGGDNDGHPAVQRTGPHVGELSAPKCQQRREFETPVYSKILHERRGNPKVRVPQLPVLQVASTVSSERPGSDGLPPL